MTARYSLEIDWSPLERMAANVRKLDGEAVLFGIPAPAPFHTGKPGKPARSGLTTAQVLAWIEFGVDQRRSSTPKQAGKSRRKRGSWLRRWWRGITAKILRGFRGRPVPRKRALPKPAQKSRPARPVIRWVAVAKRDMMRAGFRNAALAAIKGREPGPELESLRAGLAEVTRARIIDVGAVDTGQTRDAITATRVGGRG